MLVCIPVTRDEGEQSPVSAHFGSTPLFLVVDTASGAARAVANANRDHGPGPCQPLRSIAGLALDAVIVTGIGAGALQELAAAGIPTYHTDAVVAADALAALAAGRLPVVTETVACAPHAHGQGHHRAHPDEAKRG